jgi:hypothetical protein
MNVVACCVAWIKELLVAGCFFLWCVAKSCCRRGLPYVLSSVCSLCVDCFFGESFQIIEPDPSRIFSSKFINLKATMLRTFRYWLHKLLIAFATLKRAEVWRYFVHCSATKFYIFSAVKFLSRPYQLLSISALTSLPLPLYISFQQAVLSSCFSINSNPFRDLTAEWRILTPTHGVSISSV